MPRFAHTVPDHGPEHWEPIERHLDAVAARAAVFARQIGPDPGVSATWASLLGGWHDVGKYSDAFQSRLQQSEGPDAHLEGGGNRVDHSTAGAKHAAEAAGKQGRLLAYAIAAHHGALADAADLDRRLAKVVEPWATHAPAERLETPPLGLPPVDVTHRCAKRFSFQASFFTRMLFSCLIDADRLETERFCSPERADERTVPPSIVELARALERHLDAMTANAPPTPVNARRREVLDACRGATVNAPGLFSLTVPTGGGKTYASLDFALRHAVEHGLRRVIVAIPFTSIIEQTAEVYRRVFAPLGEGAVLEHHASLDPERVDRRSYLAAENWDSSLIVTTNVRLLETLFAARATPCRKLHRVAGSVIVLDEAQTLPVGLLKPALAALRELVTDYGCSIVLCTATQPALERRTDFAIGLEGVREIVRAPAELAAAMRRVEVKRLGELDDNHLLERFAEEPTWLTIVNTKAHAAGLYRRLADAEPAGLFHLSTRMCAQHRSDTLEEVRERLKRSEPCRVVSTQLIEAGVDVDFPVVFRAMAGVDSIAQAAGRCNREGQLPGLGTLWLFDPADVTPPGYLGETAQTTRELLPDYPDPLDPSAVRRYFEMHYWKREGDNAWDDNRVLDCFPEERGQYRYDFQEAAKRFRLIEDETETVFVPYGAGAELIERLRAEGMSRYLIRKLGRFAVGLYAHERQALVTAGDLEELESGLLILANADIYDKNLGVRTDRPGWRDAQSNVV